MKIKYIQSQLPPPEQEHPIIGRWYKIGKSLKRQVITVKDFGDWRGNHVYLRGHYGSTLNLSMNYFLNNATLLPLPMHVRLYHATRRFMADRILSWIPRRRKAIH